MTILVIGDANADLAAPLRAFPREGDDAALLDLAWGSGGAGVNVATTLALLGADARLLARVGSDPAAALALSAAERAGVDLALVQRDAERATGLCFAAISPGGERTFFSYRGANGALGAIEPARALASVAHVHVCGHALLEGAQRELSLALIAEAGRRDLPVSLDLCLPLVRAEPGLVLDLLPRLSLLAGNEAEIAALAPEGGAGRGDAAVASALAQVEARGIARVVVKRGERGALVAERGSRDSVAAFPVAALDSTGSGDAHMAGVIAALRRGAALPLAARLGNALGALTATRLGAADALPSRDALASFLQRSGAADALALLDEPPPTHEPR
jgi:ribokinase